MYAMDKKMFVQYIHEYTPNMYRLALGILHNREVILLYYYEQLSIKEIAKTLAVPEGTVKSRLSRGKKVLKEKWK